MRKLALCFQLILAAVPAVLSAQVTPTVVPVAPSAPPPISTVPVNPLYEAGLNASLLWQKGNPADVSAAFDKVGFAIPEKGALGTIERRFLSDWIVALTWSDPARAAAKLAEWEKADPVADFSDWWRQRLVLATRIKLESNQLDEARKRVEASQLAIRAAILAQIDTEKLKAKSERRAVNDRELWRLRAVEAAVRRAQFLVDAREKGEAVFPAYAPASVNPFVDGSGSVFLTDTKPVLCADYDLKPEDWAILEVSLARNAKGSNNAYVRPFAASSFAAARPFLEQRDKWSIVVKNGLGDEWRKAVLFRCTRNPRPPSAAVPDVHYLFELLKPLTPKLRDGFTFDMFRQSPTLIANEKQWVWLMNMAYTPEANVPGFQRQAQEALLAGLKAMEKPDPVAIAIMDNLMLRDADAGRVRQVKYWLPDRIAFLNKMRASNVLPPRILSHFELQLAQRHESNAEPELARKLYETIVARDHGTKEEAAPEQIKAQLRLAALAEASGRMSESREIFAKIGLSPDQCSIYQQRPPMVDFKHPDYSGAMLREEAEGRLLFEFDLDKAGLPSNLRVTMASPPFLFDEKTLDSFRKARFAPITNGGEALACKGAEQSFMWRMAD